MITIALDGREATIDRLEWTSDHPALLTLLKLFVEPIPGTESPDPDWTIVDRVVERYGDRVTIVRDLTRREEGPPGRVYSQAHDGE